jgi:hypothetical protein
MSDKITEEFKDYFFSKSYDEFYNWIYYAYSWSDLQWSECELNIKVTYKIIKEYLSSPS